jgi:hypothetical protein
MKPSESPFPLSWVGTDLGEERPCDGTYGEFDFAALPSLPIEARGDFAWLAKATAHTQNIGEEKAVEIVEALSIVKTDSARLGLQLPFPFLNFLGASALHACVRSNTDCFLDLCARLIRSPVGDGYLLRFLADSQGCVFWYLYLTADGSDHAVVASPDFYGTEEEQWQDEPPDPGALSYVAESFEAFICRFWLENEIWFAEYEKKPLPDAGREYMRRYRENDGLR